MKVNVQPESFASEDAQQLIAELDEHLASRYVPSQRFGPNLRADHLSGGRGVFLVARSEGKAVGCGALRKLDDVTGELKRMYVAPSMRGRGVGREILSRLEQAGLRMGLRRLVLETGAHQSEAIGLYQRSGFTPVPCWGEYAESETSRCYEKALPAR